jgi:hypothetical protein
MPLVAFSVCSVSTNIEDVYKFTIAGGSVIVGDVVRIWACCPPWKGWEIHVSDVQVVANYS